MGKVIGFPGLLHLLESSVVRNLTNVMSVGNVLISIELFSSVDGTSHM
jgi:hypothetical protein